MTQLEFSRSCPSSLQCRVGWGYPPGQLQNSCSISPDEEVSAQHFGVECGGSISKNSTWLETFPNHSSRHLRAGWNPCKCLVLPSLPLKVFLVSLLIWLPDLRPTAPGEHNSEWQSTGSKQEAVLQKP